MKTLSKNVCWFGSDYVTFSSSYRKHSYDSVLASMLWRDFRCVMTNCRFDGRLIDVYLIIGEDREKSHLNLNGINVFGCSVVSVIPRW